MKEHHSNLLKTSGEHSNYKPLIWKRLIVIPHLFMKNLKILNIYLTNHIACKKIFDLQYMNTKNLEKKYWNNKINPKTFSQWSKNLFEEIWIFQFPTNKPRGFHFQTTWKHSFPRHFNVEFTWCISRELNVSLTASLVCLISDGKKVEMIFKHLRNLFQVIFSYMIVVTVVEAFGRNFFVNFGNSVLANNNPQTYN